VQSDVERCCANAHAHMCARTQTWFWQLNLDGLSDGAVWDI
jgi:hypothetical protein